MKKISKLFRFPTVITITALLATSCVGAVGTSGETGTVGPAGPQGPIGATGAIGSTGDQGPAGTAGAQGFTGAQGPRGFSGSDGTSGSSAYAQYKLLYPNYAGDENQWTKDLASNNLSNNLVFAYKNGTSTTGFFTAFGNTFNRANEPFAIFKGEQITRSNVNTNFVSDFSIPSTYDLFDIERDNISSISSLADFTVAKDEVLILDLITIENLEVYNYFNANKSISLGNIEFADSWNGFIDDDTGELELDLAFDLQTIARSVSGANQNGLTNGYSIAASNVAVKTAANLNLSSLNTYITASTTTSITFTNVPYNFTIPGTEKIIELAVSFVVVQPTVAVVSLTNAAKLLTESKAANGISLDNIEFVTSWVNFRQTNGTLETTLAAKLVGSGEDQFALATPALATVANDIVEVTAANLNLSSLNDYITAVTVTSITFSKVPYTVLAVTTGAATPVVVELSFVVVDVTPEASFTNAAKLLLTSRAGSTTGILLPNIEFLDDWNGFIADEGEFEVALLAKLNSSDVLNITGGGVLTAADVEIIPETNLNLSSLNDYITAVTTTSITFTKVPFGVDAIRAGTAMPVIVEISFVVVQPVSPVVALTNAAKLLLTSRATLTTGILLPNVEFLDDWNGFVADLGELDVAILSRLNAADVLNTSLVAADVTPVTAANLNLSSLNTYITASTPTSITFTKVPFTVKTTTTVATSNVVVEISFVVIDATSPTASFRAATYLLGLSDSSRVVNYKVSDGLLDAVSEINTPADSTLTGLLSKLFDLSIGSIPLGVSDTWVQPALLYYYFLDGIKYNVYDDITITANYAASTLITIKVRAVVRREA
jgi:hypothetical protein